MMKTQKSPLIIGVFAALICYGMLFFGCKQPTNSSPKADTPITSIQITVIAPVNGAAPVATASGEGNFLIGAVSWSPVHALFLGGQTYTATVTLTAQTEYTFTGLDTATINGQNATVSNNTGTAVTLSRSFQTDEKTVSSMAIKTQPNLSYTHGDQLDLTDLAVTLTYNDTTTKDIAFADFATNGISTSPLHGDHLVRETNHDQPVTVTYGAISADTNNLIVNPQAITNVEISIDIPIKGETPKTSATAEGAVHFDIGTVTWNPNVNTFLGGVAYTASITLTAKTNYTFTGLSGATVDGEIMTIKDNDGDTITLSYAFPATDTRDVANMAIKTQPNLNYTHGDQLDLTNLVVTLTYDDSSSEDVSFSSFITHGITAHPANGNHLVRSEHNGHPVTITHGSNLTRTTGNLTVSPKAITLASVDPIPSATYNGSAHTPTVMVKDGTTELTLNTDYTVQYADNINAGSASITVSGNGNYTGTRDESFIVNPKAITLATIEPIPTFKYTRSAHTPTVTVKDGTTELILNTDYTVQYADNINAGSANITISGNGNYTGIRNVSFTIVAITITFNSNGGTAVAPITGLAYGDVIDKPNDPTNDALFAQNRFRGWYTDNGTFANAFDFETPITDDIELAAEWGYRIGETGPGGGIVYYRDEAGFTMTDNNETCHYLEAAPVDMDGSPSYNDNKFWWVNFYLDAEDVTGTENGIGTGRKNTAIIYGLPYTLFPATKVCKDYKGGGKTDWFLPSIEELIQLYVNRDSVGNFEIADPHGTSFYWSSTVQGRTPYSVFVWAISFIEYYNGEPNFRGVRDERCYVRPVRAF